MTPPSRRQVLSGSAMVLLAGCLDSNSAAGGDEREDSTGDEQKSEELMHIEAWVIEDVPSSIDPIPSDDDRVDGVGLFAELFEKLSDEEYERGTVRSSDYGEFEGISIHGVSATSDKAEATQDTYEDLPRQNAEGLPNAPYLDHEGEVIAIVTLGIGREE